MFNFELCLYVKKMVVMPNLPWSQGRKHGTKAFEVYKCHVSDTDENKPFQFHGTDKFKLFGNNYDQTIPS